MKGAVGTPRVTKRLSSWLEGVGGGNEEYLRPDAHVFCSLVLEIRLLHDGTADGGGGRNEECGDGSTKTHCAV